MEIIGLLPFHYYLLHSVCCNRPFTAVGVIAGITGCAAASRIISDHVVNKVLITGIPKLVRFTRLKEKRVARFDFSRPILVANIAAARDDEIKFRFSRMRMIRAKEFTFWNSDQRKIERMPLGQIERLRFASERYRDILRCPAKLSLWRLFFLLRNLFEVHFAHAKR